MVYGRGGEGNLQKLAGLVRKGIPLPLGSVANRRSIIHVDNLADATTAVLQSPTAADQIFHVADQNALSTPDIIRSLADGMGKEARLFKFPVALLGAAGTATRRSAEVRKLTKSLEVNTDHIEATLGWMAPTTSQRGIADTVGNQSQPA
jgi:UDP-glucose 4-epimerase